MRQEVNKVTLFIVFYQRLNVVKAEDIELVLRLSLNFCGVSMLFEFIAAFVVKEVDEKSYDLSLIRGIVLLKTSSLFLIEIQAINDGLHD